VGVTVPVYPFDVWIWAALDPVLVAVALILGWKSDQLVKLILVALMAFVASVLVSWGLTTLGIPWIAPIGRDLPTFFPVRTGAAFLWSLLAFLARLALRPRGSG
jgi:hypothetical protein